MNCPYCGAANHEDEHRCMRCGRRLGPEYQPQPPRSSAVPAPVPQRRERPRVIPLPKRERDPSRVPQQQPLFQVIPFDAIAAPARPEPGGTRRAVPRRANSRVPHPDQSYLPFAEAAGPAAAPAARTAVECDAPVAPIRSRCQAAAVDLLIVLAGECLFLGFVLAWIRQPLFDRTAATVYGAVFVLILAFYKLLGCVVSDRSPGMRFAGLRLLHFHGMPANRRQRLLRLAAGVLSLVPAGIGFFYALADEEHLTFHDQISGTFPTPDRAAG
jgi:uncharacterized RDD family membrane protein YckC